MHPNVHCITVYNSQYMEATYMSTDRGIDKKMWHIYTMECYSVIKNEMIRFTATWMDL